MNRSSKVFALIAAVAALLCMSASAIAMAGPAPQGAAAKPKKKGKKVKASFRIINATQQNVVKKGVQIQINVRVKKPKGKKALKKPAKLKIRTTSSTFDVPGYKTLAKTKTLKVRKSLKRTITLKLTGSGKTRARTCQARTVRVQIGKVKKRIKLKRTGDCAPKEIDLSRTADCDFIGQQAGSQCLLPFPDNYNTVEDASTPTGRRVDFHTPGMPANKSGVHVDAAAYGASDGFSQGAVILVRVPGLDNPAALEKTNPAGLANPGAYTEADTPIVVIDTNTGKRWPVWSEIDSTASTPDDTLVEIHPLTNFDAKHRYIVAMRNLKTSDGSTIAAPEGFRYYRDDLPSSRAAINGQRDRFNGIFKNLKDAGIQRNNLYLAWDFTVASDENNTKRMLSMRDKAFALLGDRNLADNVVSGTAPAFTVDTVTTNPDPGIARRVVGTFQVPCYMTPDCESGSRLNLGTDGLPIQNGSYTANYDCIIPHAATDDVGASPARPQIYGHGLFGDAGEAGSGPQRSLAQGQNFVICATDEIGMAEEDQIPEALPALFDFSKFPALPDRLQQGLLNELYLGRLMDNNGGFVINAAFHADGVTTGSPPVIDTSKLYYNGNSQGGIMGGALTAISPDFTRASLGVSAMNYSVLLPRSVDFDDFNQFFKPAYPSQATRTLVLSIAQMLWDRGEPNGYAHRMTSDPLPNTPPHKVLMNIALGDHQVSNWQANVEARTIGAQIHQPVVYPGRWDGVDYDFGIPSIGAYPFAGSALVYWDGGPIRANPAPPPPPDIQTLGTTVPPLVNLPNRSGSDPHGLPRATAAEQQMVSDFLRPDNLSQINNNCFPAACFDTGFTP